MRASEFVGAKRKGTTKAVKTWIGHVRAMLLRVAIVENLEIRAPSGNDTNEIDPHQETVATTGTVQYLCRSLFSFETSGSVYALRAQLFKEKVVGVS